jgi:hypothetical protein
MLQTILSNQAEIIERLKEQVPPNSIAQVTGSRVGGTSGGVICPVLTLRRAVDSYYKDDGVIKTSSKAFDSEADRKRAKSSLLVARQLSSYFRFDEQAPYKYSQLECNEKDAVWQRVYRDLETLHNKPSGFFDTISATTFYSHYMKKKERFVVITP